MFIHKKDVSKIMLLPLIIPWETLTRWRPPAIANLLHVHVVKLMDHQISGNSIQNFQGTFGSIPLSLFGLLEMPYHSHFIHPVVSILVRESHMHMVGHCKSLSVITFSYCFAKKRVLSKMVISWKW